MCGIIMAESLLQRACLQVFPENRKQLLFHLSSIGYYHFKIDRLHLEDDCLQARILPARLLEGEVAILTKQHLALRRVNQQSCNNCAGIQGGGRGWSLLSGPVVVDNLDDSMTRYHQAEQS